MYCTKGLLRSIARFSRYCESGEEKYISYFTKYDIKNALEISVLAVFGLCLRRLVLLVAV